MRKRPARRGLSLGGLLLRGIKRHKPARAASAHPAKARRKPLKSSRLRTSCRKPRRLPASPETLPALPPRESALREGSSFNSAKEERLSLAGLIHPDERLRTSIEAFLMDQRSPNTQRAYGKDLKRFVRFLAGQRDLETQTRRWEWIDRSVVIAYKDSLLQEKLEHSTVDRHLATLRSFFQWLVDDGLLGKSPAQGVRFMNARRVSRTEGFSNEEVRLMLALPDLHRRSGAQHYAILMLLFYCGLRRSELCSLKLSALGAERGHAVLKLRGKGNSERLVVLPPGAAKALEHHLLITRRTAPGGATDPGRPLFSPTRNPRGGTLDRPLDPSAIFYLVRKYARLAGVTRRVSPHSCRATAISNARDHRVPDRAIQEFAGWASTDMITRYDKRRTAIEQSAAHAIHYGAGEERKIPSDMPKQELQSSASCGKPQATSHFSQAGELEIEIEIENEV